MSSWLIFLVSAAAVAGAGARLARDGDAIAHFTGLGGMWVGAILVAAATSLPELTTDANAILQGNSGLAIGDLFGSSMANMAILAIADLLTRRTRMLTRVAVNQALVGTLAVCLTAAAAIGVIGRSTFSILGIGPLTLVIAFIYVAGMRLMHRNRGEREPPFGAPEPDSGRGKQRSLQRATLGFSLAALVIFTAAPFLARSTAMLADQLGIGQGFAGMIFLAITTSLPEAAVTTSCVRAGWYDLAVGNLLGSNCFNMAAIAPLDVIHGGGALLGAVDPTLAVGAAFAILLTGLAMLDILNKSERRIWIIEPGPAFMLLAYISGLIVTFNVVH